MINPTDPRAKKPKEIASLYGATVKEMLYQIGYAYIGAEKQNCDENRENPQKRFRVKDELNYYALDLWDGTSKWVDCDETTTNDEAENPTTEIVYKSIYISVLIYQQDDACNATQKLDRKINNLR